MEKYIPDIYQKSVYAIDYDKLYSHGIRCLLFNLENTLVPLKTKQPTKKLQELIDDLKEKGFKIVIFSSDGKKKLKPFKEILNVDSCPSLRGSLQKKIQYILEHYNYNQNELALIGDEMLKDIVGGNKAGVTTILINPISKKDYFLGRIRRSKEKSIMKKLRNNNLFVKGRYYE